jgi:hypothetical protein
MIHYPDPYSIGYTPTHHHTLSASIKSSSTIRMSQHNLFLILILHGPDRLFSSLLAIVPAISPFWMSHPQGRVLHALPFCSGFCYKRTRFCRRVCLACHLAREG